MADLICPFCGAGNPDVTSKTGQRMCIRCGEVFPASVDQLAEREVVALESIAYSLRTLASCVSPPVEGHRSAHFRTAP